MVTEALLEEVIFERRIRRRSIRYCGLHIPVGHLPGVVLHLLVIFTEKLFATLVSSGGNRRLLLASLHNRDFVVWTGHFVSLLSVIGGWGGVLPPHFGQKKSRQPFSDFLLGVPLCGRRVFSCKSSGQIDPMCGWQIGTG